MRPLDLPDEPFTCDDLGSLHLTRSALKQALADGRVRRILRGVYVAGHVPDSIDLRVLAVRRVVTPGHIACDRTAAWLHGVDVLSADVARAIPPVEVCALRGHSATERIDVHGRNRDLADQDVQELGGALVTTPLRTALDLGCILRRRDALAALDQFRHRFGLSEGDLARSVPRYFRRRGVVQLRALIPISDPRSESPRETWTRLAILDAGIPPPDPQFEIEVDGVVLFRLDHAYPDARTAVEYDGHEFHHTEEQLAHDARRRAWLSEHGWTVIVVRRGDFTGARLDRWIGDLKSALRSPYTNLRW